MNKISVSEEKQVEDCATQLSECRSTYGHLIKELYSQCLWEAGQIVVRHPAYTYGEKMDLYETLSKKSKFSIPFLRRAVAVYQVYPLDNFEAVVAELHRLFPDQLVITERFFLETIKQKGLLTVSKVEKSPIPSQQNFEGAIIISRSNLAEVIKMNEEIRYVRLYYEEDMETFELVRDPLPLEQQIVPQKSLVVKSTSPVKSIDENEVINMVRGFWGVISKGDGEPDINWVKREKIQAKRLVKIGLKADDAIMITQWRLDHDEKGFWHKRLTSLGSIQTHLSDWSIEAKQVPQSFEKFLDKHPEIDYRNLEAYDDNSAYVKATLCQQAIKLAQKDGVILSAEDVDHLYKASKIKVDIFKEVKK